MWVCHIQLSSHFEVTVHCFSVLVYLYIIQFKQCQGNKINEKKEWEVYSRLEYLYFPNVPLQFYVFC
jgi:hypothetical protein